MISVVFGPTYNRLDTAVTNIVPISHIVRLSVVVCTVGEEARYGTRREYPDG
jgi:hypothetical protein